MNIPLIIEKRNELLKFLDLYLDEYEKNGDREKLEMLTWIWRSVRKIDENNFEREFFEIFRLLTDSGFGLDREISTAIRNYQKLFLPENLEEEISKKTDDELRDMITINRREYRGYEIEAAFAELRKRGVSLY